MVIVYRVAALSNYPEKHPYIQKRKELGVFATMEGVQKDHTVSTCDED